MQRFAILLFFGCFAVVGAAAPSQDPLRQAQAEYRQAKARAEALEAHASRLGDRMEQLRGEQQVAVAEIDAAEAKITLSGIEVRNAEARAAVIGQKLAESRRPASLLLAGLATMARRPPLLAIADARDVDTLVRTKLLIDSTMPTIRQRANVLERQAASAGGAVAAAQRAREALKASRAALEVRKRSLASLERQVEDEARTAGEQAIGAGDSALRAAESMAVLRKDRASDSAMVVVARELSMLDALPQRTANPGVREAGPFGYQLPVAGTVSTGLGTVDNSGVRARGLTIDIARGTQIVAPASGKVLFSGPFHDVDGLLIIDHGDGWISVLTNVGSQVPKGQRVSGGEPVGRSLGPIGIELSRRGTHYSPALIAGSSGALSNAPSRR